MNNVPRRGVAVFLVACLTALSQAPQAAAQTTADKGTIRAPTARR
jgi:hypothetical protein